MSEPIELFPKALKIHDCGGRQRSSLGTSLKEYGHVLKAKQYRGRFQLIGTIFLVDILHCF
jgi:hypothetical protein